jgi:hypothetical protein
MSLKVPKLFNTFSVIRKLDFSYILPLFKASISYIVVFRLIGLSVVTSKGTGDSIGRRLLTSTFIVPIYYVLSISLSGSSGST